METTDEHEYFEKYERKKVKSKKVRRWEGKKVGMYESLRPSDLLTFLTSCFPRPSHLLITFASICGYIFSIF